VADARPQPVPVHSIQEEYFWMMIHRCECGGPWMPGEDRLDETPGERVHHVSAACAKCGKERELVFRLLLPSRPDEPIREINPTDSPSCALDVAEWMDLARFYLERIERLGDPGEKAASLLDAQQCIEEALKFYGHEDEGPPAEALWSDESRAKVAGDSDRFRRETLERMLERMPSPERLRQADASEQRAFEKAVRREAGRRARKGWWLFWRRDR
jgi:hypothetical protein